MHALYEGSGGAIVMHMPKRKFSKLEAEALALSPDERAALAQRLLLSLEEVSEPEFDRLWGVESARRSSADSGNSQPVSGSSVAKKAKALLR
jgi:hypothetical protein